MTKEDARTCILAGYDVRTMSPFDVYMLCSDICADRTLTAKALQFQEGAVLPMDARDRALALMTPGERAALRARIAAR